MRLYIVAFLSATAFIAASAVSDVATAADANGTYNWTGFYIGGQMGGGWETTQSTRADNSAAPNEPLGFKGPPFHQSGLLGGGYAGFNYQINKFVVGIDGDYSLANVRGVGTSVGPTGAGSTATTDIAWIATLSGRLGYAVNNWMFFGKGGWAWEGVSITGQDFNPAGTVVATTYNSTIRNGWSIGTGVEWGLAPNWSAKLEYDFVKFSTTYYTSIVTPSPATLPTFNAASSLNTVKLGVAYRF
jgi:outer membrane immunogenic protein